MHTVEPLSSAASGVGLCPTGVPCRQGRALGLGGRGLPPERVSPQPLPWPAQTKIASCFDGILQLEQSRWAAAEAPKSCGASARRCPSTSAWCAGGKAVGLGLWRSGDSLIRHSPGRLSPSGEALRPHVGRGQKSSGLMTRLESQATAPS